MLLFKTMHAIVAKSHEGFEMLEHRKTQTKHIVILLQVHF